MELLSALAFLFILGVVGMDVADAGLKGTGWSSA